MIVAASGALSTLREEDDVQNEGTGNAILMQTHPPPDQIMPVNVRTGDDGEAARALGPSEEQGTRSWKFRGETQTSLKLLTKASLSARASNISQIYQARNLLIPIYPGLLTLPVALWSTSCV